MNLIEALQTLAEVHLKDGVAVDDWSVEMPAGFHTTHPWIPPERYTEAWGVVHLCVTNQRERDRYLRGIWATPEQEEAIDELAHDEPVACQMQTILAQMRNSTALVRHLIDLVIMQARVSAQWRKIAMDVAICANYPPMLLSSESKDALQSRVPGGQSRS